MKDELDTLLRHVEGAVPPDFQARVMAQVAALPLARPRKRTGWRTRAQGLAFAAAAAWGASQVLACIFSLWAATLVAAA